MKYAPFVSLHNHTEMGSPLDGMNDVNQLFDQAKSLNHRAIAITDHGTLTAHYDCYKASQRTGVKLIPGMEAYFAPDLSIRKSFHLVLLPKTHLGYKNILRLNYESYKNQVSGYMGKKTPRISWDHLEKFGEDVICLTACSNGPIAKALIADKNEDEAIKRMLRLQSIFKDRLFLELQPHALKTDDGNVDQVLLNQTLVKFSRDYGINYTITCDAHYLDKDHAKYHDMMLAIKDKKAIDDPNRFRYGVQDMYLKSNEEIVDFFGKEIAEEGMRNSILIADSCVEPTYIKPSGPRLPKFPINKEKDFDSFKSWYDRTEQNIDADKAYLRYKCMESFKKEFSGLNKDERSKYWNRVKYELSILEARNFSSYMLIVADYINWAKDNDIPVGPGRGSAGGSLVSYLTGITSVNPMEYGLLFERFHNKEKKSFPDIDTDFADPPRVKQYLKEKYGEDRVASISNWSTLSPKVIIKDVARSLRIGGDKSSAFKIANHITSIMPEASTIEKACSMSKEFNSYMEKYPELYDGAVKLQGLTRNWGVHAAGVVISDEPLYESVPLRIDETGQLVTQWEKDRCEENGLIKMDILGLKTLTVIDNVFNIINDTKNLKLSIEDIPIDDKKTFDMISSGENIGVFQLESSLSPICKKVKPKNVTMVSDINALGRPSCSPQDRRNYTKRRLGLENSSFRHDSLKGALGETYGVSLYEEGMMAIAKDCAGWDLNKADALRKITKLKGKDPDLVMRTEADFLKDCMENTGMGYEQALDIWENEIIPFGKYGFNKSHSILYSHISVYTAWLKCHYPTEFMCGLLNSEDPNGDKAKEYLQECKRLNIEILPPSVNDSSFGYKVLGESEIVSGFTCMKGVGEKAINDILENQPFLSFSDFLSRTTGRVVNKTVIQSLAKAGSLDSFERTRKDMHDNYSKYRTKISAAVKKGKSSEEVVLPEVKDEWEFKEILKNEYQVLGRTLSGDTHQMYDGFFSKSSIVTKLNKIGSKEKGDKVRVEGILKSLIKEFKIKNGKNVGKKFGKYLIEDLDGNSTGLTIWAADYARLKGYLIEGSPFKAICKINEYLGQKDLSLVKLENINGKVL